MWCFHATTDRCLGPDSWQPNADSVLLHCYRQLGADSNKDLEMGGGRGGARLLPPRYLIAKHDGEMWPVLAALTPLPSCGWWCVCVYTVQTTLCSVLATAAVLNQELDFLCPQQKLSSSSLNPKCVCNTLVYILIIYVLLVLWLIIKLKYPTHCLMEILIRQSAILPSNYYLAVDFQ